MVTSLYEVTKGNIMKIEIGWSLLGCFLWPKMGALAASYSLSLISFSSWDNLYYRSLAILEGLDLCLEAYSSIILIEESI